MVRAAGSYPAGRWFESDRRYQAWPRGQAVKTSPFHGGNRGSIPLGVTIRRHSSAGRALALQARCHRFKSYCLHHKQTKSNPVLFAFSFINRRQSVVCGLPFCFILRGLDFHYGINRNGYRLSALRNGVRKIQHFFVKRKAPIFIGAFV